MPTAESKPYLYLWAAPASGGWGTLSGRASQIVRVFANKDPLVAAQDAINAQAIQTSGTTPTTDPNKVCILLQNFGMYAPIEDPLFPGYNYNSFSSFHHDLDKTNPEPDWDEAPQSPHVPPLPNVPNNPEMRYLQPWNVKGREHAKAWMEAFLNEYEYLRDNHNLDLKEPVRFHFDTESGFSACCQVNQVRILEAVYLDARWGTGPYDPTSPNNPNVPNSFAVPGSADYLVPSAGVEKTMWELYDEAKAIFGWPNDLFDLTLGVDRNNAAQSLRNRRFMLWYWEICQRAHDAAMKECAYDVIEAMYPAAQCSNYGYSATDGMPDTFGWHTGRGDHGQPFGQGGSPPLVASRRFARGEVNRGDAGAAYYWSDFIDKKGTPSDPSDDRPSLFVTTPNVASGDFSSPVLYPPSPTHWAGVGTWGDRYQYYLPKDNGSWPTTDAANITLTNGRRAVESIINSFDGNNLNIAPWIRPPGQFAEWPPYPQTYTTSAIDFRDMLAMLRAKKVPEIIVWWAGLNYEPNWPSAIAIMDRVYKPQLNKIRLLNGSCTNCPPSPTAIPVDRLRYTLREEVPNEEFVEIASNQEVDPVELAVQFTFGDVASLLGNGPMAINIECSAYAFETPAGVTDISGLIYVRDPATNNWMLQDFIDDFQSDPNMTGFGFHAPINAEPATFPGYYAPLWHETRRTFDGIENYIANDKIDIKIVFKRNYTTDPFKIRFDLVQLVGLPDYLGADEGLAQGADFNHSQTVESYDVAAFMSAYAAGAEAADFNNDGVVNADDLTAFSAAFAAGPP